MLLMSHEITCGARTSCCDYHGQLLVALSRGKPVVTQWFRQLLVWRTLGLRASVLEKQNHLGSPNLSGTSLASISEVSVRRRVARESHHHHPEQSLHVSVDTLVRVLFFTLIKESFKMRLSL